MGDGADGYDVPFAEQYKWETLEEALQVAADRKADERAAVWGQADLACAVMKQFGRRGVVGKLAEVWERGKRWVDILVDVAKAYPDSQRAQDRGFDFHRACLEAARRGGMTPVAMLDEAIRLGLSTAEVRLLGRDTQGEVDAAPCVHGRIGCLDCGQVMTGDGVLNWAS